jgi:transposase-like protein
VPCADPDEFRASAVSLIRVGLTLKKSLSDLDVSYANLHRWVRQYKTGG